jgi:hypothetical protein
LTCLIALTLSLSLTLPILFIHIEMKMEERLRGRGRGRLFEAGCISSHLTIPHHSLYAVNVVCVSGLHDRDAVL